jgi:drug/metabolite transporter (DMT)-like permease
MNPEPRRRLQADLALAFIALIWGSTFVLVKDALEDISTTLFLALRFGAATVVLATVFRRRYAALTDWRMEVQGGVLAGLFLYAGYLLQTLGLRYTTPSKSAFLTGLYIVLVPLLTAFVYKRAPRRREVIGIAMATVGMGMMTLERATLRIGYGDLLTLACALAFAGHILVIGHYSGRVSFEGLALLQVATAAILAASTFWWTEVPRVVWSGRVIVTLSITSVMATALAFAVQTWAQQFTTPARTALIFALEPVFAGLTSFLFFGERFTARAIAGAALILAGILTVELKPVQRQPHPSTHTPDL